MIICEESREIIATFFGKGKTHDYKLYEKSGVKLAKEAKQIKETDQRGKTSQSGVGKKTNQGRKCDPPIKDISDIGRALSKSKKTTRTQI